MTQYVYAFHIVPEGDEVGFRFPKIERIVSYLPTADVQSMSSEELGAFVSGAVREALQLSISLLEEIPVPDDPSVVKADGFVYLSPQEAMKLELYRLYKENCSSVADFARQVARQETAARRLLDLRHRSWPQEVEAAIGRFGKRLAHSWATEDGPLLPFRHGIQGAAKAPFANAAV